MRMKPKYNSTPTGQERRYHIALMDAFPCACGCGQHSTVVHHPLDRHPEQRWRRDHEYVVPMNWVCHNALHAHGDELAWMKGKSCAEMAYANRQWAIDCGHLLEMADA